MWSGSAAHCRRAATLTAMNDQFQRSVEQTWEVADKVVGGGSAHGAAGRVLRTVHRLRDLVAVGVAARAGRADPNTLDRANGLIGYSRTAHRGGRGGGACESVICR